MRKTLSLHTIYIGSLLVGCATLFSCQKNVSGDNRSQGPANLKIQFNAMIDGDGLVSGKNYKNFFAEDYSVKTFKFYIHAIELSNSQTNIVEKIDRSNHYLIDVNDPSSSFVQVSFPSSAYNRISFIVGVDSARNVSGAQNGALDPGKGMFWTWSTGYIMAKLEGNSPVANTPNHVIEYHIGGFKGSETVLRKVTLNFPAGKVADLKQGQQSTITVSANINSWFSYTNPIRISQNPVIMSPGLLASQVADNYSNMFTVADIVNE